jgi:hypothetical protein
MSWIHKGKNGYITTATVATLPILGRNRTNIVNTNVVLIGAASSITDVGGNAVAITATGAAISTTEPFTSTYNSVLFRSGASIDYLTFTNNAVFSAGTGDFTFEAFVYPTANRATSPIIEASPAGTAGSRNNGFLCWRDANGALNIFCAGIQQLTTANNVLPLNTWRHVVITRFNSTAFVFVDGVSYLASNSNALAAVNINTNGMLVGRLCDNTPSSSNTFAGNISNWRWIKGNAQYTQAGFTVPTADLSTTPPSKDWTRNYGIRIMG